MGKSLFSAEWTGGEPCVELMQSIPKQKLEGSGGRQHFANELLVCHHPEFGRKLPRRPVTISGGFSSMPASFNFTEEEWAAAYSIVSRDHEAKLPALQRFAIVQERIVQLAESEKLITALRATAGGDPTAIPRSWWNSERLSVRFAHCQMNPKKPFDIGIAGDGYCWIFVTRESLATCLESALVKGSIREERAKSGSNPGSTSRSANNISESNNETAAPYLSNRAVRVFWDDQYRLGKWVRFTRIVDWLTSRDKHGNRIFSDELLIDDLDRAAYLKLSKAVLLGLFNSHIILVSPTWLPEGRPDENMPARMGITIDEFREASQSSISGGWIAPTADIDLFIRAYLQNMAITDLACSDWLSREGYDLPPWLTAVGQNPPPGETSLASPDNAPSESGEARADDNGVSNSPAQEAKASPVASGTKNVGGTGKMTRSIQAAFRELWPSGDIPIGMSSQVRNDKIQAQLMLEKYSVPTKPDKRTIERALKSLNK
jgi:hypothetical protein